jgi:predicted O-methyltransferase YrrM
MGVSIVSKELAAYVGPDFVQESPAQIALREETAKMSNHIMQLGVDPAALLAWLVKLTGAKRTMDVGTFTGYSALSVAQALPADGRIVTCDVSEEWTAIARRYWERAGVAAKIDLRIGPAVDTLDALLPGGAETYDLAFIDADKVSYDAYYERCLRLLRRGGIVAFDNALWSGRVLDPNDKTPDTAALRALNEKIRRDERVDATLLTVGDGMLLARKR